MTWATVSDVSDITGVAVSAPQLAQAIAVVNLFSGRTPDVEDRLGEKDLYWLKQASCWQAAWQSQQVSFETRSAVGSVAQDDVNLSFDRDSQLVLAPLAARSLRNLSWKRSRTTGRRQLRASRNFLLESSDCYGRWGM